MQVLFISLFGLVWICFALSPVFFLGRPFRHFPFGFGLRREQEFPLTADDLDKIPLCANYYTVCATIGTIIRFFDQSTADLINRDRALFGFLNKCRKDLLYSLLKFSDAKPQSLGSPGEDADSKWSPLESKGSPAKRRRAPNKHNRQRTQFLLKAAFKLDKIRAALKKKVKENEERQGRQQIEAQLAAGGKGLSAAARKTPGFLKGASPEESSKQTPSKKTEAKVGTDC